jgi:transcriptional regulator with XRE-family HTH domain
MKTANRRRTSASNNRAHADLDDSLKRKLQNPEFRAAYDAEDKRIELVLQIIKLRQRRGMTQSDLAKAIGTRQANVSRLERFDANLTLGTLEKVAQALGANLQIDLGQKRHERNEREMRPLRRVPVELLAGEPEKSRTHEHRLPRRHGRIALGRKLSI